MGSCESKVGRYEQAEGYQASALPQVWGRIEWEKKDLRGHVGRSGGGSSQGVVV